MQPEAYENTALLGGVRERAAEAVLGISWHPSALPRALHAPNHVLAFQSRLSHARTRE